MPAVSNIRNFCIIAHIDHGKSTLADRMIQLTHTVTDREFRDQILDDMDLERERGITIKSHPVTMTYKAQDGELYEFNLIDTPGHVDFTYEVSRSMAACEGALLVVDAAQGVEAQTVANVYLAMENGLEIIPVINKIDLPNADIAEVAHQIEDILAIEVDLDLCVSAKSGESIERVLEAVVKRVPPPEPLSLEPENTRAMVFDSVYDPYRGVVTLIRVMDGVVAEGDDITFMGNQLTSRIKEVGVFSPKPLSTGKLTGGDVGYIVGTIKDPSEINIGDTITLSRCPATDQLPGFEEIHPVVFSGLYPVDTSEYEKFRQSLDKLRLNDAAFSYHPENSTALGFGFRCGFLGLLHMEVIMERLKREFNMEVISTHPAVIYKVETKKGDNIEFDNPANYPDPSQIEKIEEPKIKAMIICHNEHIGDVMKLVMDRRGEVVKTDSLDKKRVILTADLPLNEILIDFHDTLKSISRGYASMDYEYAGYEVSDIVKLDMMLNGELVDAFSTMVHRDKAVTRGRQICKALKDAIPSHQFAIPVQAAIGGSVIARETIRPFRKDVTAKLYGGDVTRKQKLLKKQKKGKKRMKQFGDVNVPQKAFISVLKTS